MARNPAAKPNPATIADQQARALDLRRKGYSIREVAAEMNMPVSTVQDRLQAALDEVVIPAAKAVLQLELERLDSWHRKLEQRMTDGEAAERIVPTLLRCQERRARYLGLDAPEKQEIVTTALPTADPAVADLLERGRRELG